MRKRSLAQLEELDQWTTLDKSTVLDCGKRFRLEKHTVRIPPTKPPLSAPAPSAVLEGTEAAAPAAPSPTTLSTAPPTSSTSSPSATTAKDIVSPSTPAATTIDDWLWCVTPPFVNVAVITREGKWLVFHQTKYAVTQTFHESTLAPVGGMVEEGEDPLTAAKRETLEETGYESREWVSLGAGVPDANRGCGVGYMFLALDATPSKRHADSDDLEEQRLMLLEEEEIEDALAASQFKTHSWSSTMAQALLTVRRRRR